MSAIDGCIHVYFTIEIPVTGVKFIMGEEFSSRKHPASIMLDRV
ncbi:MAG: hypothetical protein WAU61_02590 [Smithella sp.]